MGFSRRSVILLLVLIGIMGTPIHAIGQTNEDFGVTEGISTVWRITSINPGLKVWLGLDLLPKGTWSATNGSTIKYDVTSISPDGELFGNLKIGDFTLEHVSSQETGLNFALGFYPGISGILSSWIPGLITDLDFVSHELIARAQAALLDGSFQADEPVSEYLGKQLKVVSFSISQLGQNATLTYDKKSGLLLEARTGFGDFFINVSIESTTHTLEESTPLPFPGIIVIISLSLLAFRKRRAIK